MVKANVMEQNQSEVGEKKQTKKTETKIYPN